MQEEPSEETWLDLEKLAALIYAELEPASTVAHNATLGGRLSQSVDVVFTSRGRSGWIRTLPSKRLAAYPNDLLET